MRRYDENGREIVVYAPDELARLPRLPGANREMTDEEITAAALSDPDTLPPAGRRYALYRQDWPEALADLFPPDTVEELLAPRPRPPEIGKNQNPVYGSV